MRDEKDKSADDLEAAADEDLQLAIAQERERRQWLRAIVPLIQSRKSESDPSPRVQLAQDLMHIALCQRVARILMSDVRVLSSEHP
jgi:hypothetical protein